MRDPFYDRRGPRRRRDRRADGYAAHAWRREYDGAADADDAGGYGGHGGPGPRRREARDAGRYGRPERVRRRARRDERRPRGAGGRPRSSPGYDEIRYGSDYGGYGGHGGTGRRVAFDGANDAYGYDADYGFDYGLDYDNRPGYGPEYGPARSARGAYGRRRWRRAYDAADPEPRRRREDREDREEGEGPDSWRSRWRQRYERLREDEEDDGIVGRGRRFVRRYRQPIIGLTMAGAAAPLAKSAQDAPREPPRAKSKVARAASAAAGMGDIEEEVGRRWAESEADRVREQTVEGATVRYGINRDLAEDIFDAATDEGIDPDIAFGLVKTESAFDHRAISHVGARGLTQVMPRTASWLRPGTTAEDLYDRNLNLHLGFGYLRDLIQKYDGNVRLALLAYNRGPGTVDRVLRQGGDPNNGYADKVFRG